MRGKERTGRGCYTSDLSTCLSSVQYFRMVGRAQVHSHPARAVRRYRRSSSSSRERAPIWPPSAPSAAGPGTRAAGGGAWFASTLVGSEGGRQIAEESLRLLHDLFAPKELS
jgi:hypothetical protein